MVSDKDERMLRKHILANALGLPPPTEEHITIHPETDEQASLRGEEYQADDSGQDNDLPQAVPAPVPVANIIPPELRQDPARQSYVEIDETEERETSCPETYLQCSRKKQHSTIGDAISATVDEVAARREYKNGQAMQEPEHLDCDAMLEVYEHHRQMVATLGETLRGYGIDIGPDEEELTQRVAELEARLAQLDGAVPPEEVKSMLADARVDSARDALRSYEPTIAKFVKLEAEHEQLRALFNAHFAPPDEVKKAFAEEFGPDYMLRVSAVMSRIHGKKKE